MSGQSSTVGNPKVDPKLSSYDIFRTANFYLKGIAAGLILYLYDVIYQGNYFLDYTAIFDALLMVTSSMVSDVAGEFIVNLIMIDADAKTMKTIIIEGLLSSFIYSFGYSFLLHSKFPASCRRDNGINYMLGFSIVAMANYVENPLITLLGFKLA